MKKNLKYVYYRHPRTTQEAKANQEGWERAKRRPRNLPSNYDDMYPTHEKTWKNKRKTQYRPGGRGKKHSIEVDLDWTYEWDLSCYFIEHDIPYRIESVCESRTKKFKKWKRVSKGTYPVYRRQFWRQDGKLMWVDKISYWTEKYEWVHDGWEWKPVVDIVAYRVTWWSDKDIGIDYILKQCPQRRTLTFV